VAATRLSTKGQLIIPKRIRDRLGWRSGTTLEVDVHGDRVVLRRPTRIPRSTPDEVYGCLAWDGPPRTVEDMDRAVAAAIRQRWQEEGR